MQVLITADPQGSISVRAQGQYDKLRLLGLLEMARAAILGQQEPSEPPSQILVASGMPPLPRGR